MTSTAANTYRSKELVQRLSKRAGRKDTVMRVWDVSPSALCRAHLLGEHREIHAVYAVIARGSEGYSRHPETRRWVGKLPALAVRHARVADEMRSRGYRHASPMRATRGSMVQRSRLLSRSGQLARLGAKSCPCPLPAAKRGTTR